MQNTVVNTEFHNMYMPNVHVHVYRLSVLYAMPRVSRQMSYTENSRERLEEWLYTLRPTICHCKVMGVCLLWMLHVHIIHACTCSCVHVPCQNERKMMDLTVRNLSTGWKGVRSGLVAE